MRKKLIYGLLFTSSFMFGFTLVTGQLGLATTNAFLIVLNMYNLSLIEKMETT